MYQQDVKGKKLSTLAGIGVIALIVLSVAAAGILDQLLSRFTGNGVGSAVVWLLVVAEIFFILRLSVREYRYTLTDERLFIETRYGDNVRIVHDIALVAMIDIGSQEEIFGKYGNAQAYDKVFTRGCDLPMSAVVYRKDGENKLLSFQPDEKMYALIREHIEENQ